MTMTSLHTSLSWMTHCQWTGTWQFMEDQSSISAQLVCMNLFRGRMERRA